MHAPIVRPELGAANAARRYHRFPVPPQALQRPLPKPHELQLM